MKKLYEGGFLQGKLTTCDKEFHAPSFPSRTRKCPSPALTVHPLTGEIFVIDILQEEKYVYGGERNKTP